MRARLFYMFMKTDILDSKTAQHLQPPLITCDLVADQLTGLDLADAAEQAAELLLCHVLGQVVDNKVGLAVVICWAGLHR